MSIARAVLEFCADRTKLGAKTLFTTHYHELTVMEQLLDGVKNYNIAVKKRGDDITFLRRIAMGELKIDESLPTGAYRSLSEEEVSLLRFDMPQ